VPGGFNLPATGAYFPPAAGLAVPPMMPLATGAVPVPAAAAAARPSRHMDKSGPSGAPSKCVVMRNLFDPLEETAPNWVRAHGRMVRTSKRKNKALTMLVNERTGPPEQDTEIRDDVEAECAKQGRVLHIALDKQSRVRPKARSPFDSIHAMLITPVAWMSARSGNKQEGIVYVKMESLAAAAEAAKSLHGRLFAGRTIDAEFVPESMYTALTANL